MAVGIRSEAKSAVYRAALRTRLGCAYGFLLGSTEPFESPSIEVSLISGVPSEQAELWNAPKLLSAQLPACKQVAKWSGTEVIGLFLASEYYLEPRRNQLLGLWFDAAHAMKLRFLVLFPTDGHEKWGPSCFFTNSFPPEPLPHRTARGHLSNDPNHNPRRVRAMWNQLLKEHHAAQS